MSYDPKHLGDALEWIERNVGAARDHGTFIYGDGIRLVARALSETSALARPSGDAATDGCAACGVTGWPHYDQLPSGIWLCAECHAVLRRDGDRFLPSVPQPHLRAPRPSGPCPDGDACPDARRYGAVHPAPPASPPSGGMGRDAIGFEGCNDVEGVLAFRAEEPPRLFCAECYADPARLCVRHRELREARAEGLAIATPSESGRAPADLAKIEGLVDELIERSVAWADVDDAARTALLAAVRALAEENGPGPTVAELRAENARAEKAEAERGDAEQRAARLSGEVAGLIRERDDETEEVFAALAKLSTERARAEKAEAALSDARRAAIEEERGAAYRWIRHETGLGLAPTAAKTLADRYLGDRHLAASLRAEPGPPRDTGHDCVGSDCACRYRLADAPAPLPASGGVPLIDNGRGQLVYAPTEEQAREADTFIRARLVEGDRETTPAPPTEPGWRRSEFPCRKCSKAGGVTYRVFGDHDDEEWKCAACGAGGYVDGPDA